MPCVSLADWVGKPFLLPCDDAWITGGGGPGHAWVEGADEAWNEYPEWMDFLEGDSPAAGLKEAERDLYLHWWRDWVGAETVLDVGCGIGRMSMPFLDRGAKVWGVDLDLRSLQRFAWHAAGREGSLDLFWSTADHLPEIEPVDVVLACELLCYVPDPEAALRAMVARLKPGGAVLASVESRWGWAIAQDAPPGQWETALAGDGIVDVPGDRWVRTYEEAAFRTLLSGAGLEVRSVLATHYVTDGPLELVAPAEVGLRTLLDIEARCRVHPIWAPLHRAWTAVAVKPG